MTTKAFGKLASKINDTKMKTRIKKATKKEGRKNEGTGRRKLKV